MSLRRAVAAPFCQRGVERLTESEFVVALSLDRDWFSPDQAQRVVDVAIGEGLLDRDGDDIVTTFDATDVSVPGDFTPDAAIIQQPNTFERVLDVLVDAGVEKQEAVAEINRLQSELGLAIEAAAVLYARREGLDVSDLAAKAREEL
jgi:hypothetical protein